MNIEAIKSSIEKMELEDLDRVQAVLDRRRRQLQKRPPKSIVVEYRPHADGMLQLENRVYFRKDGEATERGSYWYFRFHRDGRQVTLYLGKTADPEKALAEKRMELDDG